MIKGIIPSGSKVLVAPLHWGLGHASRSIPIITQLLDHGCKVHIASDNDALALLQAEFPTLPSHELPSYDIHYKYQSMAANMLLQLSKIIKTYSQEKREVEKLQKTHQWDYIISDGRYGVRFSSSKNYFISHQLQIQSWNPLAAYMATKVNKSLINRFDQVWIPDEENHLLSGKLSSTTGIKSHLFIGSLSRMKALRMPIRYDIAIILSGPEPARTRFEKKLIAFCHESKKQIAVVRGIALDGIIEAQHKMENVDYFGRLGSEKLNQIICSSKLIICRAGYSSIMDLHELHKEAILVPTPGQTEQEYLAQHLDELAIFNFMAEDKLDGLKSVF